MHARTNIRMHAHTHARTHTHTHNVTNLTDSPGQNYSAAESGLQLAVAAGMPTRRENGIYSAELGLRVGSELGLK